MPREIEVLVAAVREHALDWEECYLSDDGVAEALRTLDCALDRATLARLTEALQEGFSDLADRWREETSRYSFAAQCATHPTYRRMIGMGYSVLPLIFDQSEDNVGQWYVALPAITNASPVLQEDRGQGDKVRADWLAWSWGQRI